MLPPLSAENVSVSNDVVVDMTLSNFVAEVIEASKTCLVLVDFWATWCGPCKQLGPVLEKIARASKGAVRLAKIDIDKNQPIAQQMGVQSVPSVFAFVGGRPVDGFAGALPEGQIKAWLEPLLKQTNAGVSEEDEIQSALRQAEDFREKKDIVTARAVYLDILDRAPTRADAYAGVVRCALDEGDVKEARRLMDFIAPEMANDKALAAVRAALELAEQAGQGGDVAALESRLAQSDGDLQTRYDLALALYGAGRREESIDHFLEIVRRDRQWNEEAARKQLVKLFAAAPTDPLTIAARKRLSSIIFA